MVKKAETKEELKRKLQEIIEESQKKEIIVEDLKNKIKSLENETEQLNDKILRMYADFDNYQKAVEREKEEFIKLSNSRLILDLLDDLEHLELEIKKVKEDKNSDEFLKTVESTNTHLWKILDRYGLKPIETIGKKFDPYYHEVVMIEKGEGEDGTIIEEFKKGYLLSNSILKPAKVKVLKKEVN